MKRIKPAANNHGFTLVELMIALSILSTILVMGTVIMIQISKWYAKGVNASNLQNASREIAGDITSALQFSGAGLSSGASGAIQAYCLGNVRYTYVLGKALGTDYGAEPPVNTRHVLWRDYLKSPDAASCLPVANFATADKPSDLYSDTEQGGFEMVGEHMRLVKFAIQENPGSNGSIFSVNLYMAYGDSDLYATNSRGEAICRGGKGNEYCSTSNIVTTVTRRLK